MSRTRSAARILVIGVGNEHCGDDAAGLLAARRLRDLGPAEVSVVESPGDVTELIDWWSGAERVCLIDAVSSGAPAGSLHRLDGLRLPPGGPMLRCSTHGLGVETAIELARVLKRLPQELIIYGVEGDHFAVGDAISPAVKRAIDTTVAVILEDLGRARGPVASCTNGD